MGRTGPAANLLGATGSSFAFDRPGTASRASRAKLDDKKVAGYVSRVSPVVEWCIVDPQETIISQLRSEITDQVQHVCVCVGVLVAGCGDIMPVCTIGPAN